LNPYTFHISSFYDLALLVIISIALNFALLLWLTRKTNRAANRFLAAALVVAVLSIARVLTIDIGLTAYIPSLSLAFGPLIFFYVRKLTRPEYKSGRKDLLHFIPAVLQRFAVINPKLPFLLLTSTAIYLYWCHRLIEHFYQGKIFKDGDRDRLELRWLHRLLAGLGLLWLLSIPFTITGNYQFLYLLWMAILICVSAHIYLRTEEMVPVLKPLLPAELKQKAAWLKKIIKEKRYYEDPEISLGSLAEKLGLTTHELSRVLNSALKKSFNDFINEYRVQEAIRKMQDPAYDHITLMGIAYDCGFNSNNTFYRAFREVTGKTPAEYKKELPSYNLTYGSPIAKAILQEQSNRNFMFKNHLKIAWRNLRRHKSTTFINVAGLSIGMAATILIMLWVHNELSYDRYQPEAENLYQVKSTLNISNNETWLWETSQYVLGDYASKQIPEIAGMARLKPNNYAPMILHNGQKMIAETRSAYVDDNWFKLFHYEFTGGSAEDFTKNPFSIILTGSAAKLPGNRCG
jgi:putative ABC transport system permease protein